MYGVLPVLVDVVTNVGAAGTREQSLLMIVGGGVAGTLEHSLLVGA
jgi:hypothetical protein